MLTMENIMLQTIQRPQLLSLSRPFNLPRIRETESLNNCQNLMLHDVEVTPLPLGPCYRGEDLIHE